MVASKNTTMPVPNADDAFIFRHSPPTRMNTTANATGNKWGPYSGASDFGANMAVVLAALFCTILLALSLGAAIRILFGRPRGGRGRPSEEPEKPASVPPPQQPTMLFSAAGTKLAGAEAECAICLAEFAEGEAVRVLPACNHGFHVRCIERWLAARSSCPTCRACCEEQGQAQVQAVVERV